MSRLTQLACLLVAIGFATTAYAQQTYNVTGGGGQAAIGGGLPLPIQTFPNPNTTGVGTNFPPLLIPVAPGAQVVQTGPAPHTMMVPMGVFQTAPASPNFAGVANNNPTVWQVRTRLQFTGPGFTSMGGTVGSNTFSAGGRTGAKTATFPGVPAGSKAQYSKSINQFGGASQTKVTDLSQVLVWAHAAARKAPCKHTSLGGPNADCVSQLVHAHPGSMAAAGAAVGFSTTTPGIPAPMSPNVVGVNVATTGLIISQASLVMVGAATNMATSSGFPWTTGRLRLSQPSALGTPEVFTVTGMDGRGANGEGTLSLVSGALSDRTLSGPNSNRSWARYVLPEPGAVLGAAAALAVLGICHGLVRRRSR